MRERVLHLVVGVAGRDVQPGRQVDVLDAGLLVGDARGDELRRVDELADDVGLPADEVGDELGLEAAPGQVVLRLEVAVGPPQVRPGREPVRPVDEAPLLVEPLDRAVAVAQPVDEPLEDALVVEQPQAGLVVDLVADDRRVLAVAGDDRADDPLGVEEVRRVGEVDLLARAPADRLARRAVAGDLRVAALEPHRDRVGRRPEDHADAALVGLVEDGLEPVEVEDAVLRLPGRPHRLPDADHGEARLGHQVEVRLQPRGALVLRVVGGAEADGGAFLRHPPSPRDPGPSASRPASSGRRGAGPAAPGPAPARRGTAAACRGAAGSLVTWAPSPHSTISPRYITATRWLRWRTTSRSWETNR